MTSTYSSIAREPFSIRGFNLCETLSRHTAEQVDAYLKRMSAWQLNTLILPPYYGFDLHGERIKRCCGELNIRIIYYLYTTLHFAKDAPLALHAIGKNGKPYRDSMECETWLCSSNPDAWAYFRDGARSYLRSAALSHGDHVILAPPDGIHYCQCAGCCDKNPTELWHPFLKAAVEEIAQSDKGLKTHYIAYIGRFRPPEDMSIFDQIDYVLFDTHLRDRWRPLGAEHPRGEVEEIAASHDPMAAGISINRYLLNCLEEWRSTWTGPLYVFENLMIQSSFSMPQPNTMALLEDLDTYRSLRLEGVVYEAFEPGIQAFKDQLAILSTALLGASVEWAPTELEVQCRASTTAPIIRQRVLEYLYFHPENSRGMAH